MKTVNQEARTIHANKRDMSKRKRQELRNCKAIQRRLQGAIV